MMCQYKYLIVSWIQLILLRVTCISCGDVKPERELYTPNYEIYHNVSRVNSHLTSIAERYPQFVQLDLRFKSRLSLAQPVLRLTNFTRPNNDGVLLRNTPATRTKILLSFGEHAREFLPVEFMFYIVENITGGISPNADTESAKFSKLVLENLDIFIVAMLNPDGRTLIENTANYCWRGTNTGVDLNRNFDWNFGGSKGSSINPEDEEYSGPFAFSEPETTVLLELTRQHRFSAFISWHSGITQIYVPFADSASKAERHLPENAEDLLALAAKMSNSAKSKRPFKYGVAYMLNDYTADGTIFDFMAGEREIPYSYAIELWGSGNSRNAKCFDLFNPRSHLLRASLQEIYPIFEVLVLHMIKTGSEGRPSTANVTQRFGLSSHSLLLSALAVLCIIGAIIYHTTRPRMRPCAACKASLPVRCCGNRRRGRHRRVVSLHSLSSAFTVLTYLRIS